MREEGGARGHVPEELRELLASGPRGGEIGSESFEANLECAGVGPGFLPRKQAGAAWRIPEDVVPIHAGHGGLDSGGRVSRRVESPDEASHADPGDHVDRDPGFFQGFQHADVGDATRPPPA